MAPRPSVAVRSARLLLVGLWVAMSAVAGAPAAARAQSLSGALRIPSPDGGGPFGGALAARDGKIVVGGGFTGNNGAPLYVYDATSGGILFAIGNPNPQPGDRFGAAVAWVGDDIVVGAPLSDVVGTDRGVAYLFDGTDGSLLHTLLRPDAVDGWFGYAVAGIGDDAIVGALGPLGPSGEGAYLFDGATGAHIATFTDPNAGTPQAGRFGSTVVVDGADVFIASTYGASAVYRFDAAGTLQQTYADPEPEDADEFGEALAVSGTHLAVGVGLNGGGGKVYLYDVATGALEHTYLAPFFSDSLFFGQSLAGLSGRVAIGSGSGVFVYETDPPYDLFQELHAPGPFADDRDAFGREQASIDASRLAIGAFGSVSVFDGCGNGSRTAREECDDGNLADGDGCSATCRLETCGAAPAVGCVAATKAQIAVHAENSVYHLKDSLKWTWVGPATDPGLFGDPLTSASFSLCIYDRTNGPTPRLRMQPAMLAGGLCVNKPCWKTGAGGVAYADKERTPSGVERFTLRTGGSGMKALVLAKGADLGVPPTQFGLIAFDGQVTVQLRSAVSATCLQADFPLPARLDAKQTYKDRTN